MEPSAAAGNQPGAVRARDDLLARAAHDVRTPLASILTWLRVLRAETLGPQGSQAVAMAERAARELGQIVAGLEDAHQLMAGSLQLRRLPVDMVAVVSSVVEATRPAAAARSLPLESSVKGSSIHVRGDAERLQHVLSRLLLNAVVLTSPGGRIDLSLDADAAEARVAIRCLGLGFTPAHLEAMVPDAEWPCLAGPGGQVALDLAVACRVLALHAGALRTDALGEGRGLLIGVTLPIPGDLPPPR